MSNGLTAPTGVNGSVCYTRYVTGLIMVLFKEKSCGQYSKLRTAAIDKVMNDSDI